MRGVALGVAVLVAVLAGEWPAGASCPSVLVRGSVAEIIDFKNPPVARLSEAWENLDYWSEVPNERCMRTAYLVLGNVESVEPAGCDVPSTFLLRIYGWRGWRVWQGEQGCEPVGQFFTDWHVGDTVYALVYEPGTGSVVRCSRTRCAAGEEESAEPEQQDSSDVSGGPPGEDAGARGGGERGKPGASEPSRRKWMCDQRMIELTASLPQRCTLQENVILVRPLREYLKDEEE